MELRHLRGPNCKHWDVGGGQRVMIARLGQPIHVLSPLGDWVERGIGLRDRLRGLMQFWPEYVARGLAVARAGLVFAATLDVQPDASAGKDACLRKDHGGYNYGAAEYLLMQASATDQAHALIEFDCSSIPQDAHCDAATLYLYHNEGAGDPCSVNIYSIALANANWPEGTHSGSTAGAGDCCWDHLDAESGNETNWAGSVGCSTSGTDYESSAIGSFSTTGAEGAGDEESASLNTERVGRWFGLSNANYGIILINSVDDSLEMGASDNGTSARRPRLVVVYTPAPRPPAAFNDMAIY